MHIGIARELRGPGRGAVRQVARTRLGEVRPGRSADEAVPGRTHEAVAQLQIGLRIPGLTFYHRSQFEARLQQFQQVAKEEKEQQRR